MPTIIDSLIVKLGLDSKDLEAKGGAAGKTLGNLEKASKGTEGEVKSLGKAAKSTATSVDTLARSVGTFLATLGGTLALRAFIEDTIASNAALDRLSKNLGLSVSEISAWGNAVEEMGGSAKGLQGTLSMLSQSQTELRLTGQSSLIPYFNTLQIAMTNLDGSARPVNDILLDLADRFERLDRPTANNLGRMMGIDQDTLNLLLQGRREVEMTLKRQKEYNAVTKEQAEQSAKLQRSLIGLRQSFTALGRDLLSQATPAIERFLNILSGLANWAQNNREFIKDLGLILGTVAAGLTAISIASSPLALVIGGVILLATAIALLWQDYQTWKRGGDSLIDWEKWKPGIDAAKKGMEELKKIAVTAFEAIGIAAKVARDAINGNWGAAKADLASGTTKMNKIFGIGGPDEAHDQGGTLLNGLIKKHLKSGGGAGQSITDAYAMKYFQDRGLSSQEAAGLASQIHSESSGRANAVGDNGKAYGLIQFHADRQANFKKFAGHDIRESTPDEQLAYMVHELQSTERAAGERLRNAASAKEAGEIASKYYVRPADREGEASRRGSYAQLLSGVRGASQTASIAGSPSGGAGASNDNRTTVTTGPITINTKATDADGIARDFAKSFNYQFTAQANTGLR